MYVKLRLQRWHVALGLGACVLLFLSLLHTPPARRYALSRLRAYFSSTQGIELTAASLRYNLLTLSVEVDGLVMRSTSAEGLPPFATVDSARAGVSLLSLLRRRPVIEDVRLAGVDIKWLVDARGRDNLPHSEQPGDFGQELPFLIRRLEVQGGALRYSNAGADVDVSLPFWILEARGDREAWKQFFRFRSGRPGNAEVAALTLPVRKLAFDGEISSGLLELRSLELEAVDSLVEVSGTLRDFVHPALDVAISADLGVESLARILGAERGAGGRIAVNAAVTGPLPGVLISSRLSGTGLSYGDLDGIGIAAAASWVPKDERIRIDSFGLTSRYGAVSGQASLSLSRAAGPSSAGARFNGLDLATLSRNLNLPIRIAGRASGDAEARWAGMEFEEAEATANVRVEATRPRPLRHDLPITAVASASAAGGRVRLDLESGEVLGVRLRGLVSLTAERRLDGDFQAATDSLARLLAGLEAVLGREPGSIAGVGVDGPASIDGELSGDLRKPRATVRLSAPATTAGELAGISLKAEAVCSTDRILFERAELAWKGERARWKGEIGFGSEGTRLNLDAHVAHASVGEILDGLGRELPVEGDLDLDVTVGGTADDPYLSASASLSNLRAYGAGLGTLSLQAGLAGRRLELRKLELAQAGADDGKGRLIATGTCDLDSGSYAFQTGARQFGITGMKLPGGFSVRGELDLSASGSGSFDAPSLDTRLDVSGFELNDRPLGTLNLVAQVERRHADVDLQLPLFNVGSKARIGIDSPYPARVEARAETDISLLRLDVGEGDTLEGTITAALEGSGDLEHWRDSSVSLVVTDLLLRAGHEEIRNEGPLELGYGMRTLQVRSAKLTNPGSRLAVSGSLPLEAQAARGSLEVEGSFDLAGISRFLPQDTGFSATGVLRLNGELRGSLEEIDPRLKLGLAGGTFRTPILKVEGSEIALDAEIRDGTATIRELSANLGAASIRASGEVPLGSLGVELPLAAPVKAGTAKFSAEVTGLRAADFRDVPAALSGTASFRVEGESSQLNDLNALSMTAVFSELQLETTEFEIVQTTPAQLSLSGGTFRIDRLLLEGPDTRLQAKGTAALTGDRPLDLHLDGDVNLAVATLFARGSQAEGESRFGISVGGSLGAPEVSGFFETTQGQFTFEDPPLAATGLDIRLRLDSEAVSIERFSGKLNGGSLAVAGTAGYGPSWPQNVRLSASLAHGFFEYPQGLRTEVSADLTLRSDGEFLVLGGAAHVLEGNYRRPLELAGELLSYLQSGSSPGLPESQSPLLSRLRFNAELDTQGPLLIDNNLAKLTASADLRLTGSYFRPGLVGRVRLDEGGQLFFNERTYLVERGTISFDNQARIEPELDIRATTRASGYDISLNLTGTPDDFSADLTSEPTLSQPDIIAVLLTGRRLEELQGSGLTVAREQVESYLSGRLAGVLSRSAQETLGLSLVRIDPSLISPEANPGARLTVGQDVTNSVRFIYSTNLVDANDQILTAQYDVTRRFETEATRQSDNTYRFDFGHDLQFGGSAPKSAAPAGGRGERKIGTVELQGNTVLPPETLLEELGARTGDKYDFFRFQKGLDRLRTYYQDRGYLESRLNVDKRERGQVVEVVVRIEAGPRVEFAFEGQSPPGEVIKRMRSVWQAGLFDGQRVQEAVRVIREGEVRGGHLQAKVDAAVSTPANDRKRVTFSIDRGVRFRGVRLALEGVSAVNPEELKAILKDEPWATDIHVYPRNVITFLEGYYRRRGYLDARVRDLQAELDSESRTGSVVLAVDEGPEFKVGTLALRGNNAIKEEEIRDALPLGVGDAYRPELLESAASRLEELYWSRGFSQVVVDYSLNRAPKAGELNIDFRITENKQQVVEKVEIDGNRETSGDMIRSQITLSPGDVLDYRQTNDSRRRLYDTNAYSLVDIQPEPVPGTRLNVAENQEPVALKVKVREVRPFDLRYGGFYDTERGPGGIVDFSNRNSLGSARLVGARFRYDSDVHEFRGYFGQPYLRRFPVSTNATAFFRREITEGQDTPDSGFITDRTGFTLQQEARFGNKFILSYGYRFQRNHTYDMGPDPFFDITLKTAPLTATLSRDNRDDLLDASRGSFASQAFEYAPSLLGSDLRYIKYLGQYFHYLPLSSVSRVPWSGVSRSRLVFAGAVRVGLAGGIGGQDLIPSDKFFAGGGTTIRGFGQNEVSPRDFFGDPIGGNALLVLNGELRFGILSIFDGVGFLDVGNVFPRVEDFDLTKVRKAAGFGLRVRTPYFLLRADYGIKLDRKPGESFGRFFFSIGQAF